MARIEAEVTANIGPFERALTQATHKAREFAEQSKDVGKDVFKETVGGGAFRMTGMAGGVAAATAFGASIVEAAKSGLEAFGHMETQILRLKYNLKDPTVAKEVHEWLEGIAGSDTEVDKLHDAFVSLSESGLDMEKSKAVLVDLQAVALKSGDSVDSLAEAFRRAKAGGLDAGEGAAKLLKSLPGLATEIEKQKNVEAQKIEDSVTNEYGQYLGSDPAKLAKMAQAKQLRGMSAADYVKTGRMDTQALEEMLHRMAPREMMEERKGTLEGAEGRLSVVLDNLKESFGEGLAPAIKAFVNDLNDNLPTIEDSLKDFGTALGNAVNFFTEYFKGGKGPKAVEKGADQVEDWIMTGLSTLIAPAGDRASQKAIKEQLEAWDYMFSGGPPGSRKEEPGMQTPDQKAHSQREELIKKQESAAQYLGNIDRAIQRVFTVQ